VTATPDPGRPGDELVADANMIFDRRWLIAAPPEQIWPWLVQLGKQRAGWYLPRRLEEIIPRGRRASRAILSGLDALFNRLPFVRLLYSSTRDLLNAFVGEQRRFDKPVLVALGDSGAHVFGFLTQESMDMFGVADAMTVYVPQSYGFAGNLVVFPAAQVRRLEADSAHVMAFIVSGGVTTVPER